MRYEFTPAAERALLAAAGWISYADVAELHLPEVLLGLLAEPECRAALLLAQCDVDPQAVHRRFPNLAPPSTFPPAERAHRFSAELTSCLDAAENRLIEYPSPLVLATEHVLLGLVATENEVAQWLADCGLRAEDLEQEIHRLAGHKPGPLPLEITEEPLEWTATTVVSDDVPELIAPSPSEQLAALRITDAAANRASEGLRVIEDYLRFALDDGHLTLLCKSIRHELAAALAEIAPAERHAARETQADVGTHLSLPAELVRANLAAVVQANFKRVEQSLRSLEEFSKISAPQLAAQFEQLRYRIYTLERAADITRTSLDRLSGATLCVLIDGGASQDAFRQRAQSLIAVGVPMLQLRDKKLPDRELAERARLLGELTRDSGTLFIVNDRPDLALLAGADGVHVGQDDLPVKDVRQIVGPNKLVGVSTHSLEQARAAVLDGANYFGVGPVFPSGTKSFAEFPGLDLLQAVAAEIALPAFAIGGITLENIALVLEAGIQRVAVSGAIATAADPAGAARRFLAALS
jgi:thiamine-phosphate pyrophosphorylase